MNSNHLTSEQIDALLLDPESLGAESIEVSQHLSGCPTCSAEFESLQAAMRDLRMTATATAERHLRVAAMPARSHRTPRMVWGLLAATALVCIAGPLAVHQKPTGEVAVNVPSQKATVTVSDEQLLSDIQDDLSSKVPRQMLPLAASVVSTDPATATGVSRENE